MTDQRSASPSPLQMAAKNREGEARLPKGHCRYILLLPEIKGQRCACVAFSLNKEIPSATCDCGHLACYHTNDPEPSTDQRQELEALKQKVYQLEAALSRGHDDVVDRFASRFAEVEDHVERHKEEVGESVKNVYRNVCLNWDTIQQTNRRLQQQEEQIREMQSKLKQHAEQIDELHASQLELRDADISLEERIENLTELMEEQEEMRQSSSRPSRRRSTSDASHPNVPLTPLGQGAAPSSDSSQRPSRSPAGGPVNPSPSRSGHGEGTGREGSRPPMTSLTTMVTRPIRLIPPLSARSTEAWTVHISLLPHASLPMPFERNTNAYQRCLSRGLHQMVAVQGRDWPAFKTAVEKAFGRFLRGREWMPLQAKLCDAETLQGLPMLRQLDPRLIDFERGYDHAFLRRHCAVCDSNGMIDSLYIAMRYHTISWHTLRHSPVYLDGLEGCWKYDHLLDSGDPFPDSDDAIDDQARPAAGDITTVLPNVRSQVTATGVKRPLSEMSRSASFGSATAVQPGPMVVGSSPSSSSSSSATAVPELHEDQPRAAKRMCPAVPIPVTVPVPVSVSSAASPIVEVRRRDIKTA
ncbi:uncharacterized protein CTHT_0066430 [Thermochaetoides thermophila DSM 1495]|uniref:Uncharacterized protein n=1 Tax=Chaetomium thermophilum (strain DSM 1495 / CBS 144.50 / IMI 039719) TaxID=759272 RepID=G0SGI3_CHATD|nr:hypothetical protein CTHT_0066430 [Thermochaetoides thermophila DSM 1495]EGS17322.1 hypothetical protein CTHT_0066430 [Thermochaetoides thermophila DSM 1495]